ncbi:hypothetical protein [Undibacterium squillarum]|uniref:hypothetical protein n=1 Tax=Undibacterium squillarum TaxID=1131567 RepID=UPI0035B0523F
MILLRSLQSFRVLGFGFFEFLSFRAATSFSAFQNLPVIRQKHLPNAFAVYPADVASPAVFPVVPALDLCSYPHSRFPQARTFCRRPPDRCAVVRIQAVFGLYLGFAERFPAL